MAELFPSSNKAPVLVFISLKLSLSSKTSPAAKNGVYIILVLPSILTLFLILFFNFIVILNYE